jgi:hypothetical protein
VSALPLRSIHRQFEAFFHGFRILCDGPAIRLFNACEVERLVSAQQPAWARGRPRRALCSCSPLGGAAGRLRIVWRQPVRDCGGVDCL